jgi:hypothetical protein
MEFSWRIKKRVGTIRFFHAEVFLGEFKREFKQDSMRPTFRVPKKRDSDMPVAELEQSIGSTRSKKGSVGPEDHLYSMPPMGVCLLSRGQCRLQDFQEVLRVHGLLLPLFVA